MAENIIERSVEEEMKTSYLNYAMSVIISRALPDVRDGLKPVHRRILYAMHQLGLVYNRPYKKSAYVVGEVLAKYHPHGDQAVYDTLVRMAQDFSLRLPLIQGQGNFGSMDGDNAAAMRYTEARMARVSDEMLRDIQKETIDFANNYDDSIKEPTVLPSIVPNLLVNGSSGIAVGMATSMPPHNLKEICEAVTFHIDKKVDGAESTVDEIMQFVTGPDFPTGGLIYNLKGIREGYRTGKGIFKIRARVSIEEYKKDCEALIATEIPYQVNKAEMIKKIAALVKNEAIQGISEIRDESDRDGVRVVIELKKDVNTQVILNQLYKHTPLETSFSINNIAIVNRSPKTLNIQELIHHFVNHRFEVTTRRIKFDLKKAEERAHIVEGLIKAVDKIDEVIKIIKSSETVEVARKTLMATFEFSEVQAQAILDMRLARLVALEIKKLQEEFEELMKLITEFKDILSKPARIYEIIKQELATLVKTYGTDRKSELVDKQILTLDEEDYIQKSNIVVSLNKSGYIKRTQPNLYKQQHRGGVGVKTSNREEDVPSMLFVATTHDTIMFFSNLGKAYYLKGYEIPEASRTARGTHIKMLLQFGAGEYVQGVMVFRDFNTAENALLATANGVGKKLAVKDLINAKKRGVQAINLQQGDTLVGALGVAEGQDVVICSRRGNASRVHENQFRVMGRAAGGVRALSLESGDEIVGIEKVVNGENLMVVTERGMGKKINLDEFSPKGRGGKGQIYLKPNEKTGEVASIRNISDDDNVLIITSSGQIIRLTAEEINLLGRPAIGTRLVTVDNPDFVVDTARIRPLADID